MALISRELTLRISHFEIGDYIEYGWFRGEIVSLNANSLQQLVRVQEVIRPAIGRAVGSVQRVPFNLGREYARPEDRNSHHSVRGESQRDTDEKRGASCNIAIQQIREGRYRAE